MDENLRLALLEALDYLILGVEGNNHTIREELMRILGELRMLCGKII